MRTSLTEEAKCRGASKWGRATADFSPLIFFGLEGFPFSAQEAANAPALLFVDDETYTAWGTAAAGVKPPFGVRETVIEGELLASGDVAACDDPDPSADVVGPTIWSAGMVNQTGDIAGRAAVEVVLFVEIKNINAVVTAAFLTCQALLLALAGLGFRDALAGVFDHACFVGNVTPRINATSVNRGFARADPSI